ncbi:DNA-processing protein DprA [Marinobacter zhanjiangensis]|uniref:DNA processing protein DprA n=1 Tax=Marinobacter zhanjiangensis TaxID=578215 RepID=A0ABQ3ANS5_9GAMM|nr:DNA-processing protein DprA [Marinobacter zhanjiangensis]GGY60963.1 DNA processing protein DprA [Marinobacter zhanjiangensis]
MPTSVKAPGTAFLSSSSAPWLLLGQLPRFSGKRWLAVCDAFADPLEFLDASAATHKAFGAGAEARAVMAAWQQGDLDFPLLADIAAVFDICQQQSIQLLGWGEEHYPEPLRHIQDAPAVLYLRGRAELLSRPQIAIVGSRNATRAGLDHAWQFAGALTEKDYAVTSGLAQGVDGAAHAGALAAGGDTVAVVGTGADVIYPRSHRALTGQIIEQGVLVSEYPPGTQPRSQHFPKRNRIISGLSRGILVVEAGLRSGSLITARLALEQGREVFAIPGSIHNPLARGCHSLIRQGAKLVETVDDIEEELAAWWNRPVEARTPEPPTKPPPAPQPELFATAPGPAPVPDHLDPREIAVLNALGYDPCSTDQLCAATGLPADQLMQSLLLLEMEGLVESAPGGYLRVF